MSATIHRLPFRPRALRRRAALQARANEWASIGYWWGVQATAPFVLLAFLAGVAFTFTLVP